MQRNSASSGRWRQFRSDHIDWEISAWDGEDSLGLLIELERWPQVLSMNTKRCHLNIYDRQKYLPRRNTL